MYFVDHAAALELVKLGLLVTGALAIAAWLYARHRS